MDDFKVVTGNCAHRHYVLGHSLYPLSVHGQKDTYTALDRFVHQSPIIIGKCWSFIINMQYFLHYPILSRYDLQSFMLLNGCIFRRLTLLLRFPIVFRQQGDCEVSYDWTELAANLAPLTPRII
jgi:hypothetical protein